MGLFSGLLRIVSNLINKDKTNSRKSKPVESRQSGISGGMSTTELLIRLELVMGQGSGLPLMDYATELAKLSHPLQLHIFSLVSELSDLSYSHACEFLAVASTALTEMEQKQYERWLTSIKQMLHAGDHEKASEQIRDYEAFTSKGNDCTAYLSDLTYTLEKLLLSIYEFELPIREAEMVSQNSLMAYASDEELYLPVSITYFDNYEDNYRLYKAITFQLLGQLYCGSSQAYGALSEGMRVRGQKYFKVFSTIETLRIDQYIKRQFPGLWRDFQKLHQLTGVDYPDDFFGVYDVGTVETTLHMTAELFNSDHELPALIYESSFQLEVMARIQESAEEGVAPVVSSPKQELAESVLDTTAEPRTADRGYFLPEKDNPEENILLSPPPGWITSEAATQVDENPAVKHHEKGVYYYREWDTSLQKYRKDWCRLTETIEEMSSDSIDIEYNDDLRHAEQKIRKTFDQLVNDQKFMRAQSDGDELDIDAWVSARAGKSKDADDYQNLYIKNNANNRDVAIMFAVDLSGSTAGWKNTIIKQSTWLLCKTMARLGDQYAVYGFSGAGRKDCRIYPVKTFDEDYSKVVKERISALKPHQYTRMGVAIRHLSMLLGKTSSKTRILFVLTDGRPDDLDSYRGQYGVEDTRLALNEAKALSLKPFVLTFDKEGMDYLPYMLGSNRYRLITDISQLPVRISTIYKQLTT